MHSNELLTPSVVELVATVFFIAAVVHTFLSNFILQFANRFPEGSVGENLFHLLGEVEIVFGLWGASLIVMMAFIVGKEVAISYAESLNFSEPIFVFVIMTVAATRPVIELSNRVILGVAKFLPLSAAISSYFACLTIGPLLGSFITEPAAMTVTALILKRRYFDQESSLRFKYVTLAVLFVNISIGGVLTPFSAPPVLMVARKWHWDFNFMIHTFGWKAVLATCLNALCASWLLQSELKHINPVQVNEVRKLPFWLIGVHLVFLALIVTSVHHPVIFIGIFLFFMGVAAITREYQTELKLRESLLVAFFLGGLVVLGGLQSWWITPLIRKMDAFPLFLGTSGLTAITDNAALTYLGAQVVGVSETFKYALVAGAVAGGGLTVIANAPNPAGYSILQESFSPDGINAFKLFLTALIPTLISMACLWLLP